MYKYLEITNISVKFFIANLKCIIANLKCAPSDKQMYP